MRSGLESVYSYFGETFDPAEAEALLSRVNAFTTSFGKVLLSPLYTRSTRCPHPYLMQGAPTASPLCTRTPYNPYVLERLVVRGCGPYAPRQGTFQYPLCLEGHIFIMS